MSEQLDATSAIAGLDEPISRIFIETPDINGLLRGKNVLVDKFRSGSPIPLPEACLAMTTNDELVDVAVGQNESGFPDVLIAPDWSTLRMTPGHPGMASVIGDGVQQGGALHGLHSRSRLKEVIQRAADLGFDSMFGVEYEFWIFRSDGSGDAARRAGDVSAMGRPSFSNQGYSLLRWPDHAAFAEDLAHSMAGYAVPIETIMTEIGNGLLEAAIAPAPALEAADAAARFKVLVREVAQRHGLFATFMAKLIPGEQGSSGHLHQSLWRDGRNVFWDGSEGRMSREGLNYAAGLMQVIQECGAFFAPFVNSYRRFEPDQFVPLQVSWGWDDRLSPVRAITSSATGSRFEMRRSGADLNPYLAIAACIAGGVSAIERDLKPGPPSQPQPGTLASTLGDAADALDRSELARDWLGNDMVDLYVASRRHDQRMWDQINSQHIPSWEVQRYFEVV